MHSRRNFTLQNFEPNMDWEKTRQSDWFKSLPQHVQKAKRDFPEEEFYQRKDIKLPVRIYGIGELKEKDDKDQTKLVIEGVSAHIGWVNDVVGGYALDDVEQVESWTDKQIRIINTLPKKHQEAFLKKDGVFAYIWDHSK